MPNQVLLSKAQLLAHRFASNDPTRPHLTGVHVSADGMTVVGTDGTMLAQVTRRNPHKNEFPIESAPEMPRGGVILPTGMVAAALKALPKKARQPILAGNAALESVNGTATLVTTDLDSWPRQTARPIEGPYPDVTQVVPKERAGDVVIGVNPKVAAEFFSALAAMMAADGNTSQPVVMLRVPANGLSAIRADWTTYDHEGVALLMPCRGPKS